MTFDDFEIIGTDYIDTTQKELNYSSVAFKLEEAIGHLQDLLKKAEARELTDSWYTIGLAHAMTDLNEGFNLRYPGESPEAKSHSDFDKLPWEIVMEWGHLYKWPIRSMDDFVFKGNINDTDSKKINTHLP